MKRSWIEPNHPELSIRHQCELLQLNRATFYRQPGSESEANLELMRRIDEQFLRTPFYGSRRMAEVLGSKRRPLNRKHMQRLMRLMGLEAIYPKPHTTRARRLAQDLPVFAAESGDNAAQPGVVVRHHVRADAHGLHVPDGRDRLVQPLRAGMAFIEHAGRRLLRRGVGSGLRERGRRFSTRIRECSSRVGPSRADWNHGASPSA